MTDARKRWYRRLLAERLVELPVLAPDGTRYLVRLDRNAPVVAPSGVDLAATAKFVRDNLETFGDTGWRITVLKPSHWHTAERVLYTQHVGAKAIVVDVTVAITDALERGDVLWDDN